MDNCRNKNALIKLVFAATAVMLIFALVACTSSSESKVFSEDSSIQPDSFTINDDGTQTLVFGDKTMVGNFSQEKQDFPANDLGLTYGSLVDINPPVPRTVDCYSEYISWYPDLIAAVGEDGTSGYVYKTDLLLPEYQQYGANTARADAYNSMGERTLPLFAEDGTTMIGTMKIGLQ